MNRILFTLFTLSALSALSYARILNVPEDYQTIQAGIDASEDGDTVLVAPGTYQEALVISRKNIVLSSLAVTTGDSTYLDSTILDGSDLNASVIKIDSCGNGPTAIVGFTVTNGNTDYGGGIYIRASNPTIRYARVNNCSATSTGGGIYVTRDSRPVIESSEIANNEAILTGGGISTHNSAHATLSQCIIADNNAQYGGGIGIIGLSQYGSSCMINDCTIEGNVANTGGGVYINSSDSATIIQHCRLVGNVSELTTPDEDSDFEGGGGLAVMHTNGLGIPILIEYTVFQQNRVAVIEMGAQGGGAAISSERDLTISFCSFALNEAEEYILRFVPSPNGMENRGTVLNNCIVYTNNSPTRHIRSFNLNLNIEYCDIEGGQDNVQAGNLNWGEGNLDADPFFIDPDNGDYRLTADSPCIDAGDPEASLDPDGTRADMGAFFFDQRLDPPRIVNHFPVDLELDVELGDSLQFTVQAVDERGDSISYAWKLDDDILSVDSSVTLAFTSVGQFIVRCSAADGFSSDSIAWTVEVHDLAVSFVNLHSSFFNLQPAFPNPFNSTTTIRFSLESAQSAKSAVKLAVYDLSGRLVHQFDTQELSNSGTQSLVWNADGLPGGIYFVRLQSGSQTAIGKVLLIR